MPRMRTIKHGFYTNDRLAEMSFATRLLFPGLWILADREGRLEDRPKKIKGELFPYDDVDTEIMLKELAESGFIDRYSVNGCKYIQIINFTKHQYPHAREAESAIPPPEKKPEHRLSRGKARASIRPASGRHQAGTENSGLGPEKVHHAEYHDTDTHMGMGSGEGGQRMSWATPYYDVFKTAWDSHYAPSSYDDERHTADFVQLAGLRKRGTFNLENWTTAVDHYFKTPQASHTMKDLASRFAIFLASPLDRFAKPVKEDKANNRRSESGRILGLAKANPDDYPD